MIRYFVTIKRHEECVFASEVVAPSFLTAVAQALARAGIAADDAFSRITGCTEQVVLG